MTEPGQLGEEAARLLGAAQGWLHRAVLDPRTTRVAAGSPECCWCPFCQLIAAARGDRPELAERLSETMAAMSDLQGALAGLLRSVTESMPGAGGEPAADQAEEGRPAGGVQRIDLSGEDR